MPSTVLVLCPMRVERDAVAKAVRRAGPELSSVRVVQTGIGKGAILREIERACADGAVEPRLIVLAGVCGGLVHTADVPPIDAVVDEHGGRWTPRVLLGPNVDGGGHVTLIGVDHIVDTPEAKRALAERTGAAIVDMEAHAFAARCEKYRVPWAVVRGVSDTPEEMLPAEIVNWMDAAGNTRPLRAARDLALKPRLIPPIVRFARRTGRVMPAVGARVVEIVRAFAVEQMSGATGARS